MNKADVREHMSEELASSEYLVLSRGRWDAKASKADIEAAIGKFYLWLERNIDVGRMRTGSRLTTRRAMVSGGGIVTDGPFGEAKEVIGGYWFIIARSLQEAAELARESPCLQYGLVYEIRPLDPERGSAYRVTNETPQE